MKAIFTITWILGTILAIIGMNAIEDVSVFQVIFISVGMTLAGIWESSKL